MWRFTSKKQRLILLCCRKIYGEPLTPLFALMFYSISFQVWWSQVILSICRRMSCFIIDLTLFNNPNISISHYTDYTFCTVLGTPATDPVQRTDALIPTILLHCYQEQRRLCTGFAAEDVSVYTFWTSAASSEKCGAAHEKSRGIYWAREIVTCTK